MYDKELVVDILQSVLSAAERIMKKMEDIRGPEDFFESDGKRDALDVLCMQLTAIGESLKQVDKITGGRLLADHPQVDWKGLKGIRDVIVHQYFDIGSEAVFDTCRNDIPILKETLVAIISDLSR
jgi:uncharacterized protein with HEPN domain